MSNIIQSYIEPFCFSFLAVLGYCFVCQVPKKCILPASICGGFSWLVYVLIIANGSSKIAAAFVASILVAILSDIFSRIMKEAATIFIIPGIIPYVPGAGMYYTMVNFINGDYASASTVGTETMFVAASIAIGLIIVGIVADLYHSITKSYIVK